jgi:hypothetical protein
VIPASNKNSASLLLMNTRGGAVLVSASAGLDAVKREKDLPLVFITLAFTRAFAISHGRSCFDGQTMTGKS